MAKHALSEAVKKQKARNALNRRKQDAIATYQQQELKPDDKKRSLRAIAEDYRMLKSTLSRLVKGGVSMSAFHASAQKLTPVEERVVIDFALESADRGFPLSH